MRIGSMSRKQGYRMVACCIHEIPEVGRHTADRLAPDCVNVEGEEQ